MSDPRALQARPVRMLAAGGTISMQGERAVPTLDADALVQAIPDLAQFGELQAENVLGLPGPQISLPAALTLARRATEAARGGEGVVITTGTDTLEELAMLCALCHGHDGAGPIILTGANRTASAAGADGPANLLDSVALAASPQAGDLGVVVVFGGEIHAAASARKVDSTGPAAFGSPMAGPVGRVVGGRVWLHSRPLRPPAIVPETLEHRVPILTAALGEDGRLFRTAAQASDGLVVVAFGAGHLPPGMLDALSEATHRIPVLVTVAPEHGAMLHATYGFTGSERDVRATGAICTPFLAAPAARMALLCCLGAGLDRDAMATKLAQYDA